MENTRVTLRGQESKEFSMKCLFDMKQFASGNTGLGLYFRRQPTFVKQGHGGIVSRGAPKARPPFLRLLKVRLINWALPNVAATCIPRGIQGAATMFHGVGKRGS